MSRFKIKCPNCGRILGDTEDSLKANFNCRGCKQTVQINIQVAKSADYFGGKENNGN